MFGWLDRLWRFIRRDDRLLFRYWDGGRWRAIDPLAAHRGIWVSESCDLLADSATARNPPKEDGSAFYPIAEVHDAEDRLRAMTRQVFGVKEWTESQPGLTLDETDDLLVSFLQFCTDLKKKRSVSPIPSAPTESTVPPSSSDTEGSPAGVSSDSTYSPNESTAAVPSGL